jgi:uncharacterized membrane protein YgaE (UPF0421/DUF939 family)
MISIVENIFFKSPEEKARIAQAKMQEEYYKKQTKQGLSEYYKEHPEFKNIDPRDREYVLNRTSDEVYKNSNMKKHVDAIRKGEKFDWPKKK